MTLPVPSGHDLGSVWAFRSLERRAPFRTLLALSTFRAVQFGLRCFQLAALVLAGPVIVLAVVRPLSAWSADPASTALLAVVVVNAYVVGSAAFRFGAGRQLQDVLAPPHAALFRALDVPRYAGFVAGSLVPVAVLHLALLLTDLGAVLTVAATTSAAAPWWLLAVPVAGGLGVASVAAVRVVRARPPAASWVLRGLVVLPPALAVGVGAGWLAASVRPGSLSADSVTGGSASPGWPGWLADPPLLLVTAVLAVIGLEAVGLRRALHTLAAQSYEVRTDGRGGGRRPVVRRLVGDAWSVETSMTARFSRTLRESSSAPLLLSSLRTFAAVTAGACGVALGGVHVSDPTAARAVVSAGSGYLFVTALIVVGLTSSVVGPTASLRLLRYEWESSAAGARSLALRAHVLPVLLAALPAVLTVAAQWALTGTAGQGVALALALVGGFTLTECLVAPQTRVDGSTAPGPLAPLVLLLLTAPVPALAVVPTGPVTLLPLVYSLSLLGVGGLCLSRRIVHLPSSSPGSPSATCATDPLS